MSRSTSGVVHVLTVHFNTPELTSRLVRDFPQQTPQGRPVRIHVLDNCSTHQNLRTLRENIESMRGVVLEISDKNIGFGAGVNLLAASDTIASSDIVWILNPDTRLMPGCLEFLESEVDSGNFSIVSPLIFSGDDGKPWIWFCGGAISTSALRAVHQLYGRPLIEAPSHSFETEFITGAAPMMLASTFRAVGGYPPHYFLYWEDAYFCWKARGLGFRLGVVPAAHLWHAVGASSGSSQSPTFYYWTTRNRFVFGLDIGISRRRMLFSRNGLESLRPTGRALLVEREGRVAKTLAAFRGTIEGLRRTGPRN